MKTFTFLLHILCPVLLIVFSHGANAIKLIDVLRKRAQELNICENYLTAHHYKIHGETFGENTSPTLAPEPDSIEARNPGLIRDLVFIRMTMLELDKTYLKDKTKNFYDHPDHLEFLIQMKKLKQELKSTFDKRSSDPRTQSLAKAMEEKFDVFIGYIENKKPLQVQMLTSHLWEVIVACLFNGESFYLNRTISQLVPDEWQTLKLSRSAGTDLNREIDIAILMQDGSWRWIEVKDWSRVSIRSDETRQSLFAQGDAQNTARKLFPQLRVQLDLVMKYGLEQEDYLLFAVELDFDHIYFIFPDKRN